MLTLEHFGFRGRPAIGCAVTLLALSGSRSPAQVGLPGNVVEIVAGDYFLRGPDSIPAGLTTFQLRLHSGGHALWVVKLEDGKTVDDYLQSWKTRSPRPWARTLGGPGFPSQDRPANATMILEPGNYVLADVMNEAKYDGTGHLSKGMYKALTVVPSASSSPEPAPDIVIRMTDGAFEFSRPLTAGRHVLRVENAGTKGHEFQVRRLLPGKTAADLAAWRRRSGAPQPAEAWGGLAGFSPGQRLTTTLEFIPGEYVITSCCGPPTPAPMAITVRPAQARPPGDAASPLIEAIWKQDVDRVKQLLDEGADPNATHGTSGRPAWVWAIVARDDRATDLLLSKVKTVDRATALLYAANRDDVSLARALLDKGMPVDARAVDGATALLVAAASGHARTIEVLVERRAGVNLADDFGDTALMAAVRAGSLESVNRLLAAGADASLRDESGRSALAWAQRSKRADVLDALRAKGASGDSVEHPTAPHTPRAAAERSLPLIQRGTATWNERQRCAACHHHPMMFRATALARRLGFAVDQALLKAQVDRFESPGARKAAVVREAAMKEALESDAGVIRWSLRNGGDPSFGNPWFLSSFADAGVGETSTGIDALLTARMQLRDGRWRYGPPRVPIESSDFTATASAVRSLQAFGRAIEAAELGSRLERAAAWLRTTPAVTTDDKAFRLFGLNWTKAGTTLLADAVTELRQAQNRDGGWPQLRGLNSDAYATGMVLVALHEAGGMRTDDPVYQRGVKYLLDTQEPDGSWLVHKRAVPVNEYFESGFPHGKFQFISYAGTCWAAMALMYAATAAG